MKHKNGDFAVILFIYWSRFCILYSFASMFFQRQGFSAAQIGELAAVSGLAAVFGGPAAGMLADKIRSESKVILMCLVFTLFLTGGVYIGRSSFWSLLFLYGAVSLFDKAISPLLDSWVVKYGKEQYGKIRAVGSLGGALCAIVIGIVIDRFGFGTVFKIHMLLTAVMFVLVLFMKRGDTMIHQEHSGYIKEKENRTAEGNLKIFGRKYIVLLCTVTLLFFGVTVEVTYYPVLFGECGGSAGQLGLALFIMSSSEVAGLFFYRRLRKKLRLSWVMLLSLMVYTLKLGLQIWLRNVLGLIILQLLQAGAFGTFLPAVTEMVPGLVPKERTATALSISNACMQGVGVVLGNWTAGAVCEFWGLKTAYTMGACMCCIATVLFVCAFRDRKNTEQ